MAGPLVSWRVVPCKTRLAHEESPSILSTAVGTPPGEAVVCLSLGRQTAPFAAKPTTRPPEVRSAVDFMTDPLARGSDTSSQQDSS
ncbi:hypothetical protein ThimaDRAFT_4735 [Thiocapsa marina 5811]|uniref:Uncharacterized protein n=1 Tax=Thiocapsa marina 5811 TaxID=768671 RepID=F9UII2_9GAMM|nr:hypothetical protein ThimaDRAFT_4735 [Thiocapsa marina 5811]